MLDFSLYQEMLASINSGRLIIINIFLCKETYKRIHASKFFSCDCFYSPLHIFCNKCCDEERKSWRKHKPFQSCVASSIHLFFTFRPSKLAPNSLSLHLDELKESTIHCDEVTTGQTEPNCHNYNDCDESHRVVVM